MAQILRDSRAAPLLCACMLVLPALIQVGRGGFDGHAKNGTRHEYVAIRLCPFELGFRVLRGN